ncbi:alkaline phosphatase family protein [Xanthocytophaga agilis]|uniref:Alkaline phosphatase family protein n=1 Tax=Xanthocytophaga agilis TaxID=3048010 RepID=A0AAE3UFM9_9BACT|nr:alkaline phosphatase family protein [Xanthocytophaga agilis]MDJ1504028.1 alkaline phosphatase family protein [Xanthocytophaga agilis]
MKKTVVIDVVGLTTGLIGENTPFLKEWSLKASQATVQPVMPAVTCTAHATYYTGKWPDEHGIVANGWYYRDVCEVRNWHQSNKLVEAPKIWEVAKELDPTFTCANMGWWFNMYSSVDYSVTPRPQYLEDGRKFPDCYTQPADLRDYLQAKFGTFPLFTYWGPNTNIKSTQWLADASIEVDQKYNPTLTLIYLPHLDYNLQRIGPEDPRIATDLQEIDKVCKQLVEYYESKGAQVILLSEYGITQVDRPIMLNRVLRKEGLLAIREERGLELLDAGASDAFAVADHQIAHIYVKNEADIPRIKKLIEAVPGVDKVYAGKEREQLHLAHSRAGEIIAIADARSWFGYYYWFDDAKAPDFARLVAIHKKPGFDPVELHADPKIKFLLPKVAFKVLKKKLGFRMLMDIIPLDPTLVKGSHGRMPDSRKEYPLIMTKNKDLLGQSHIQPTEVFDVILAHLKSHKEVAV